MGFLTRLRKHANLSPRLRLVLRAGVSAAILWMLSQRIDFHAVFAAAARVPPGILALALAAMGAGIWLDAVRWWMLQHPPGIAIPLRRTWQITLAGMFFNVVLPGNTGGDLLKLAYGVRERPERRLSLALSVVLDRFFGFTALFVLALVAALAGFGGIRAAAPELAFPLVAGLALAVGALAAAAVLATVPGERWPSFAARLVERLPFAAHRVRIKSDLQSAFTNRWSAAAGAVAFAMPLLMFSTGWLLARSMGIEVSLARMLVIMPLAFVVSCLPVSFGGLGVREGAFVLLFTAFGVTAANPGIREAAVAFSLLYYAVGLAWSLLGGAVYLSFKNSGAAREPSP
ncbi:MAG: lysylphosphatidylglycerol synthase transmembrane domain-containing protein [Chthoniobacteraceae bacterium]